MHVSKILLGMEVDDTAAGNHVTAIDRHKILGQAMDYYVMTWFGAIIGSTLFP